MRSGLGSSTIRASAMGQRERMATPKRLSWFSRLAAMRDVVVAAGGQLEEERGEDAVQPERARQVRGDVAVAGARHAEVHLVEQDQVRVAQRGVGEQRPLDLLVLVAVLDVPVHGPHARRDRATAAGEGAGIEARRAEQALEPRVERRPFGRGAQRLERGMAFDRAPQRAAFLEQDRVAHGRQHSAAARVRGPRPVGGRPPVHHAAGTPQSGPSGARPSSPRSRSRQASSAAARSSSLMRAGP